MADEGFKPKLAAILSADVEGHIRLMDDDEEATLRTLTTYATPTQKGILILLLLSLNFLLKEILMGGVKCLVQKT
jgi:hypothetical protein